MNKLTADRMAPGSAGRIKELNMTGPLQQRLLELGLIPGTILIRRWTAPSGSPIAFEAGGTLLALRESDAAGIVVQEADVPWTV